MTDGHGPRPEDPEPLLAGPDMKGIAVDDVEGRPAGVVFGSLSETASGLIRYVDVSLHHAPLHVLVPLGHARLQRELDRPMLKLRAATRDDLRDIPAYDHESGVPDEAFESAVLAAHGRLFHGERYYAHPAYDHGGLYAGEHPIVREGAADEPVGALEFLSNLKRWRVAEGEPDVRGWELRAQDGPVGTVSELVVDPDAGSVRYLLVKDPRRECDWFLPIGFAELDRAGLHVVAPALRRADLEELPRAPSRPLTREEEIAVLETLEARLSGPRRFARPDFRAAGID